MFQPLSNTGALPLLTRYDFPVLRILGETGTGKTHTAGPFASGKATENLTEVALTKKILKNRPNKEIAELKG